MNAELEPGTIAPRGGRIDPERLYHECDVILELGLSYADLKRARAAGLRCRELARNRRVYLGRWLLDWFEGGGECGECGEKKGVPGAEG